MAQCTLYTLVQQQKEVAFVVSHLCNACLDILNSCHVVACKNNGTGGFRGVMC